MIASGVVGQVMSHNGYGWCVSLLTLLAIGAQGQDIKEPWTPYLEMPEGLAKAREGISLETPEPQRSPAREPSQHTTEDRQTQATTPVDDPWCEETKHRMEKAERSLLISTTAGAVCQIIDSECCGLCVLTLAVLASGVQAEEKNGSLCLREKRAASQENY